MNVEYEKTFCKQKDNKGIVLKQLFFLLCKSYHKFVSLVSLCFTNIYNIRTKRTVFFCFLSLIQIRIQINFCSWKRNLGRWLIIPK